MASSPKTSSSRASSPQKLGRGFVYSSEELDARLQEGQTPVVTVVQSRTGRQQEVRALNVVWLAIVLGLVIVLGSAASMRYTNRSEGEVLGARDTVGAATEEEPVEENAAVEETSEETSPAREVMDEVTREIKTVGLTLEREFTWIRAGIIQEEE